MPILEEPGHAPLFETGAILLDVAERSGRLLPENPSDRSRAICWLFAALNSVEPQLMSLAEVDFFPPDEGLAAKRRPAVVKGIKARLDHLSEALGGKGYLVGKDFTVADMMMSSVLKILRHTDILDEFESLRAYRDRCFARPAYLRAIADQCTDIAQHVQSDMKYEHKRS